MRFAAVALAASIALVLSGCVPTATAPAQPEGAELAKLTALQLDLQWQYLGLTPDSPKPSVAVIRYVSAEESEAVHASCLVDAGYADYAKATGVTRGFTDNFLKLAIYTCIAEYPVPPSTFNLYGAAQLDYLYDYYVDTLIPCIESAGLTVENVPSRAEFGSRVAGQFYNWTPFDGSNAVKDELMDVIYARCPGYPPGL